MTPKKLPALIAAGALAFTLAACGGGDTTDDTTTETTTAEAAATVDQTELDNWAKGVVGLGESQEFIDAATDDFAPSWAAPITGVRLDGSNLYITSQIDRNLDEETAEKIQNLYVNSLRMTPPEWGDQVDWVIVEDGTNTVVTQESI